MTKSEFIEYSIFLFFEHQSFCIVCSCSSSNISVIHELASTSMSRLMFPNVHALALQFPKNNPSTIYQTIKKLFVLSVESKNPWTESSVNVNAYTVTHLNVSSSTCGLALTPLQKAISQWFQVVQMFHGSLKQSQKDCGNMFRRSNDTWWDSMFNIGPSNGPIDQASLGLQQ